MHETYMKNVLWMYLCWCAFGYIIFAYICDIFVLFCAIIDASLGVLHFGFRLHDNNILVCSLQELSASGRTLPCDSIFEQAVLQDCSAPVAFIFGGEVGQLLPDLVVHCDAGAFIPSWVRLVSQNGLPSDQIGHGAQSTVEDTGDANETAEARSRTHSCNLCIAACIVLSERFRHRLASIKTCSARPQSQWDNEKILKRNTAYVKKNRLWSAPIPTAPAKLSSRKIHL